MKTQKKKRFFFLEPKTALGFNEHLKKEAIEVRKHILITLHGTFAADEDDEVQDNSVKGEEKEERWWQRKSGFLTSLQKQLAKHDLSDVFVLPFHWDGNNTDSSRLKASRQLTKDLVDFEREGLDYSIIAHSHGGNVFMKSLHVSRTRFFESKPELVNLKNFISIGSPFYEYKRKPMQVFLLSLILAFVLLWLSVTSFHIYNEIFGSDPSDLTKNKLSPQQALIALMLFIGTLYITGSKRIPLKPSIGIVLCTSFTYAIITNIREQDDFWFMAFISIINFGSLILGWSLSMMIIARMLERWKNKANIERVKLSEKGLSIISHRDEVMAILSNSISQKLSLVQAKTIDKRLSGLLESVTIIAIPLLVLSFYTSFNAFSLTTYPSLIDGATYEGVVDGFDTTDSIVVAMVGFVTVLSVGLFYLGVQIFKIIIRYTGTYWGVAKFINFRTLQTLKGAAFGDDSEWRVKNVRKIPFHVNSEKYQFLEIKRDNLGDITQQDIVDSASEIHQLIENLNIKMPSDIHRTASTNFNLKATTLPTTKSKKDMQAKLKEAVLKMLYHNAYFDDEGVINAIAEKLTSKKKLETY